MIDMNTTYIILLLIGFVFGKWIITIIDSILEVFYAWLTKIVTSITIETNLISKDYQDICNENESSVQAIGYQIDESVEGCCEDDCDCKGKIGFRK